MVQAIQFCAERRGFEPPIRFPIYILSKDAHSTTLPPLRTKFYAFNRSATLPLYIGDISPLPSVRCTTSVLFSLLLLWKYNTTLHVHVPQNTDPICCWWMSLKEVGNFLPHRLLITTKWISNKKVCGSVVCLTHWLAVSMNLFQRRS